MEFGGTTVKICSLGRDDLPQVHRLTSEFGWSTTFEDITNTFAAYPHGFEGAFLQDGTLICKFKVISIKTK